MFFIKEHRIFTWTGECELDNCQLDSAKCRLTYSPENERLESQVMEVDSSDDFPTFNWVIFR